MIPGDEYLYQFDFSNKLLIDSWCSIFRSVNNIFDRGVKHLLGCAIPTDKSEYVAKFRFASVCNTVRPNKLYLFNY